MSVMTFCVNAVNMHLKISAHPKFCRSDMPGLVCGSFIGEFARDIYKCGNRVHTYLNNGLGHFERDGQIF